MFRNLAITTAALMSLVFVSPAQAQLSKYGMACADGIWNALKEPELAERKLTERVTYFSEMARAVLNKDSKRRDLEVVVTDCPMYGYTIRAVKYATLPLLGGDQSVTMVSNYGLYVTVSYLRNADETDLARNAVRQACIIRSGGAENTRRPAEEPRTPIIMKCILDVAIEAGDTELARWLTRELEGAPRQQNELNAPQREIQEKIDKLKALPQWVPPAVFDTLERFERSFD